MSLKVWLPLDGTLRNLGIGTVTTTATTPSYTTGKIGLCYNGTDLTITFGDHFNKVWSIAFWGYVIGSQITSNWTLIARLNDGGSNLRIEVCPSSYNNGVNCYSIHNNANYNITNGGINSPAGGYYDLWVHFCLASDGTTITKYMNGKKIGTCNYNGSGKINGTFVLANNSKIYKNDFRVYDHCLSAAEVREISLGLVCHYKLDEINDNYSKNNNTAWTNITIGLYYTIIFSYTMADFLAATGAKNGDKFTWSLDINATGGTKHITARVLHYISDSNRTNVMGNPIAPNTSGRSSVVFTVNTSYNRLDFMITNSDSSTVTSNTTEQYKCTRILAGDIHTSWLPTNTSKIIEDSSGYNHNGTIVGNLNLINNTPRYSAATNFNGSSAIKYTSFNLGNIWSAGMWFYSSSSVTTGWGALFTVNTSGGDADLKMNLYIQLTSGKIQYSANGLYDSSPTFTKDVWHHLMETFDGATLSCYLDGALIKTKAITNAEFTRSNLYVGARSNAANGSSASNYVNAYISDFRIYCTALNAAAVKQLYELGAKVDNKGNIHGYEFVENNSTKITKKGQVMAKITSEVGALTHLKYDKEIYIEPDGSRWVRIYHHNNPGGGSFSSSNDFVNSVYIDENRWFNVEVCNYIDKWEFMIKGKFTSTSAEWKLRFIQTKNPMVATFADVAVANITKITTEGYSSSPSNFGGLYAKKGSAYLTTNNGNAGNWWGAVGSYSVYQNGIPGWGPTGTITTTGFNDLYVRIDNITYTAPKALADAWQANQLIEI